MKTKIGFIREHTFWKDTVFKDGDSNHQLYLMYNKNYGSKVCVVMIRDGKILIDDTTYESLEIAKAEAVKKAKRRFFGTLRLYEKWVKGE